MKLQTFIVVLLAFFGFFTFVNAQTSCQTSKNGEVFEALQDPVIQVSGETTLDKNVVLFFLDDPTLDAMKTFSRLHLYQRKIDGSFDPEGTDPVSSSFYVDMPVIERMARSGVTFTEFRTMPTCSPSRACLLTGMYPFKRHGQGSIQRPVFLWGDHFEFNSQSGFVYPVISEFIRAASKKSAMVGKWHLANDLGRQAVPPLNGLYGTGWDHIMRVGKWDNYSATFGNLNAQPIPDKIGPPLLNGSGTYYHYFVNVDGVLQEVVNAENESHTPPSNRDHLDRTGYATRTQAIDVVRMINTNSPDTRFFMFASFNSIHTPLQPPPVDMVRTDSFKVSDSRWASSQGKFVNSQAMMESIDFAIGHVLDGMDPVIRQKTVFILAGDNGTSRLALSLFDSDISPEADAGGKLGGAYKYVLGKMDNDLPPGASPALGPRKNQSRMKVTCFERGIRAPLIIWDPSGEIALSPGRESTALVDIVDLMPTILDIMGVPYSVHALDGKSLLPVLMNDVSREAHTRQYSFSETYAPTGTGPLLNPRNDPDFIGEWNGSMGMIPVGKIVSFHNNLVRFYKALIPTFSNPWHTVASGAWQTIATKQRSFIVDVVGTQNPGTYKVVRNYFEDDTEFVDHFYKLYDQNFNAVDPIEAYQLDTLEAYAAEYQIVRNRFDQFLNSPAPSQPIF